MSIVVVLPGAVRAEEGDGLAGRDVQVHAAHGADGALGAEEGLREPREGDARGAVTRWSRVWVSSVVS